MIAPQGLESGPLGEKYVIERRIGAGATATVHRARDTTTNTVVAIKILRQELAGSAAAAKFLKEIHRTSALEHPFILPVLDSGEWEGRPYFVLPFMEGGTLRGRLEKDRQLPIADVIVIARVVAEALDYANERGLVHRDVKPENILFTGGEARLADFGIARALQTVYGDATTSSATIRGTPAYMSPEQAAGSDDLDGRSDQYALACVVYEMISGMQAFMGPTPEAVMAQRFKHTPRDIGVFRPTAPAGIGPVMTKAFALAPADRYPSCSAFVDALAAAPSEPVVVPAPAPRPKWQRGGVLAGIASMLLLGTVVALKLTGARLPWTASPVTDTSLVVVLPFERATTPSHDWRDEDLLLAGLGRYRGVTLVDPFQAADALRRRSLRTPSDAAALARSLGAGRYVRATLTASGSPWRVSASLYDVARVEPLYQAFENVSDDLVAAAAAYARLADSLLLRGIVADSTVLASSETRSLPAIQAFSQAQAAIEEWDLIRADSGFRAAADFDPSYARAHLWQAQVRAWQGLGANNWRAEAERAAQGADRLNDREARLVRGLLNLARGSYAAACADYDSLAHRNAQDFAAWFGLGQCQMLNRRVVRDALSPSGWRFEMNAHRAMLSLTRALEILPSIHHGYEHGAFQRLRLLLLLSNQYKDGFGPDSARFYARPGWIGDTLVLVPYPAEVMAAGGAVPPGFAKALAFRRKEFRRLAALWSAAFPQSPGAKQAVALALEQLGDASAIDTLQRARSLAQDPAYANALAAAQVLLLVKFGIPNHPELLRSATLLGDSLLAVRTAPSEPEARSLLPVAIVLGRCDISEQLMRAGGIERAAAFSFSLFVESYVALVRNTLGCPSRTTTGLRELASAIDREAKARGGSALGDGFLLLRPALQSNIWDEQILSRLSGSTNHKLARAALFAVRSENDSARAAVEDARKEWIVLFPTPDFAYVTARVLLQIGDTVGAARVLDSMFSYLQSYEPEVLAEPGRAAGFIAAVAMRARIAAGPVDASRHLIAQALSQLWARADSSLKFDVDRAARSASGLRPLVLNAASTP